MSVTIPLFSALAGGLFFVSGLMLTIYLPAATHLKKLRMGTAGGAAAVGRAGGGQGGLLLRWLQHSGRLFEWRHAALRQGPCTPTPPALTLLASPCPPAPPPPLPQATW